jgi:hypothetical protein
MKTCLLRKLCIANISAVYFLFIIFVHLSLIQAKLTWYCLVISFVFNQNQLVYLYNVEFKRIHFGRKKIFK